MFLVVVSKNAVQIIIIDLVILHHTFIDISMHENKMFCVGECMKEEKI